MFKTNIFRTSGCSTVLKFNVNVIRLMIWAIKTYLAISLSFSFLFITHYRHLQKVSYTFLQYEKWTNTIFSGILCFINHIVWQNLISPPIRPELYFQLSNRCINRKFFPQEWTPNDSKAVTTTTFDLHCNLMITLPMEFNKIVPLQFLKIPNIEVYF